MSIDILMCISLYMFIYNCIYCMRIHMNIMLRM